MSRVYEIYDYASSASTSVESAFQVATLLPTPPLEQCVCDRYHKDRSVNCCNTYIEQVGISIIDDKYSVIKSKRAANE